MAFHQQSWARRKKSMGKPAEREFRRWADQHGVAYARFGFDLPPFKRFGSLPVNLRYAPDYVLEEPHAHRFAEVKGCGRDGIIKLKHDQFEALCYWEEWTKVPVSLFFYDSATERISPDNRLGEVDYLRTAKAETAYFVEPWGEQKPYYVLPTSLFDWTPVMKDAA